MNARIDGPIHRYGPPEFQAQIDEIFGYNRFGGPLFKIVWGQTDRRMAAGLDGYEEELTCAPIGCWNIMRWIPPEAFGTPNLYYSITRNSETGLYENGEYPWEGRYEVLQPLMHRSFNEDKTYMQIDAFPLSHRIIELMIPILARSRRVSYWEIKAAKDEQERIENTRIVSRITDRMMDSMPAYIGPVSFRGQGTKNSSFQQRMEAVEQSWKRYGKRNWQKGFGQN